ncbi:MAG: M56 family metallopeptidase [bacterium]|nr:M56 family metallopeptidase [bacterium]
MNSFLLYLMEASIVLVLLYALYLFLLRKETFFSFNRFFLMAILVFSFLFPWVSFEISDSGDGLINEQITELGKARNYYYITIDKWAGQESGTLESDVSWFQKFWQYDWSIGGVILFASAVIYVLGLSFLLFRLFLVYIKIYSLKRKLSVTTNRELKVAKLPAQMAPFSFMNTVFMPDNIQDKSDFDQILAHEETHIRQRHSIDLIFVQLLAAIMWFNPVVWQLIKSLKQTHEYIADKNMLQQGFSLVEYQSLLLRQLISNNSYGLVHNFNLSFIKKRISMMSIKESGWAGKSKAVIAMTAILMIGFMTAQCNSITEISAEELTNTSSGDMENIEFYIDEISINGGLKFSKVEDYKGEFKFKFNNNVEDYIVVGIELIRDGEKVAHMSQKLKEGTPFEIKRLLNKAELEDYLIIDIIEGPTDAVKLYKMPLFRESDNWKMSQGSDLPPPPVTLFVEGIELNGQKGLSLEKMKSQQFSAELEYVLSPSVDYSVLEKQAGDVKANLVRKGVGITSVTSKGVKKKGTIKLDQLLKEAQPGDAIVIQFGDPDGLRFSGMFFIE